MCLHDFLIAHASHLLICRGIDICIAGENVVHHIVFHGLLEQQPPDAITEHTEDSFQRFAEDLRQEVSGVSQSGTLIFLFAMLISLQFCV